MATDMGPASFLVLVISPRGSEVLRLVMWNSFRGWAGASGSGWPGGRETAARGSELEPKKARRGTGRGRPHAAAGLAGEAAQTCGSEPTVPKKCGEIDNKWAANFAKVITLRTLTPSPTPAMNLWKRKLARPRHNLPHGISLVAGQEFRAERKGTNSRCPRSLHAAPSPDTPGSGQANDGFGLVL